MMRSPSLKVCNTLGLFCSGPFSDQERNTSSSHAPTFPLSNVPSDFPSFPPSISSESSSEVPSDMPSIVPSDTPSLAPSNAPSLFPSDTPSLYPSVDSQNEPISVPFFFTSQPSSRPSVDQVDNVHGIVDSKFVNDANVIRSQTGELFTTAEKTIASLFSVMIVSMLFLLWKISLRQRKTSSSFRSLESKIDEEQPRPSLSLEDALAPLSSERNDDPFFDKMQTSVLPWEAETSINRKKEDCIDEGEGTFFFQLDTNAASFRETQDIEYSEIMFKPEPASTLPENDISNGQEEGCKGVTRANSMQGGILDQLRRCTGHQYVMDLCTGNNSANSIHPCRHPLPTIDSGSSYAEPPDVGLNPFEMESRSKFEQMQQWGKNHGEI